jgi:hypothetical protein
MNERDEDSLVWDLIQRTNNIRKLKEALYYMTCRCRDLEELIKKIIKNLDETTTN